MFQTFDFFKYPQKSLFNMKHNNLLCLSYAINFCVGICIILQIAPGDLENRSRWQ